MVKYKYVALYGANKTSNEYDSSSKAISLAQKYKQNHPRAKVYVDKLTIFGRGRWSQSTHKIIKLKK